MKLNKYWFKPKLYGYGAYPNTIEGWLSTALFIGIVFAIALNFAGNNLYFFGTLIPLIIVFVIFCRIKTDGKWAWNWGKK